MEGNTPNLNNPLRIENEFGSAELDDQKASMLINTGMETFSLEAFVENGELCVRQTTNEQEVYEGPSENLRDIFELYLAAAGLRGNLAVIGSLLKHKGHPDVDALLVFLNAEN